MTLGDFIRNCDNERLSEYFTVLLINILNVLELGTGGIDLQNEVVAFYEMLGDTVPEGLEESMRMVSRTSDLLS